MYAYVSLKNGFEENEDLLHQMKLSVRKGVGPFAVPDVLQVTPQLPKTRSGKIMRRILRAIAENKVCADPAFADAV